MLAILRFNMLVVYAGPVLFCKILMSCVESILSERTSHFIMSCKQFPLGSD